MPSVGAVIVAGGAGARFDAERPKQFQLLAGRPVVIRAATAIARVGCVREIVFVLPAGEVPREADQALQRFESEHDGISVRRVTGGPRRQDSVAAGLGALSPECQVALVHDGARPFPPGAAIERVAQEARDWGAALLATRVTDTVKREGPSGRVGETMDRGGLWLAQTPQAFRAEHIEAMIEVLKGELEMTDESAALESLGVEVALVEGSWTNLKITRPEDLEVALMFLERGFVERIP